MRIMEKNSDILRTRKDKIEELKNSGINLFPNGFIIVRLCSRSVLIYLAYGKIDSSEVQF